MDKTAEVYYSYNDPQILEEVFPPILYKYRDWHNPFHQKVLTNQELYVPNAISLNDPFDSNIELRFKTILPNKKIMSKEMLEIIKMDKSFKSRHERKLFLEKALSKENLKKQIHQYNKNKEAEILNSNNKKVGIVSMSAEKYNILMWSHYSNGHRGFAVGFDTKKMSNAIGKLLLQSFLTSVQYSEDYPTLEYIADFRNDSDELLLFKSAVAAMATKSIWWAYEKEFRMLIFRKFNSVISFPVESVKEILLGFQIDKESKNQIIEICKSNFPLAEIYQGQRHKSKFEIYFEKISI